MTFEEAIIKLNNLALLEIEKETEQKKLYYHNCDHARAVQKRAEKIFQAIIPFCEQEIGQENIMRMKQIMDICAISHDLVQEFISEPKPLPKRTRKQSEGATIAKLLDYINNVNQEFLAQNPNCKALFTDLEIKTIKEAIEATICLYDKSDKSLYQPALYHRDISLIPRIIGLADLGGLGINGVEFFLKEGSLIFLEDNLDIIPIISRLEAGEKSKNDEEELFENMRQRLLKRARFQINFAKGRKNRIMGELEGLPGDAIVVLKNQVFKYLTEETIEQIELLTPTADDTKLEELIDFFQFKIYI